MKEVLEIILSHIRYSQLSVHRAIMSSNEKLLLEEDLYKAETLLEQLITEEEKKREAIV